MDEILGGKIALVTGGSRGLGAEIARRFAAAGASVVVNYATDADAAGRVVAAIETAGGSASAVRCDVSAPQDVDALFEEVAQRHGRLDVLVNNAGVYESQPIGAVTPALFQRVFGINVLGPLLATRSALPLFGPAGGSIVNISALAGQLGSPDLAVYAGSKGAIDAMTRALAKELGPRGIRVNALSPGSVMTDGLARSGFLDSPMHDRVIASTALGRLGQASDIADAATFLASDASAWITGQVIQASGGLTY